MDNPNALLLTFRVPEFLNNWLPAAEHFMLGQEVQASVDAVTDTLIVTDVEHSPAGTVVLTLVKKTVEDDNAEG